MIHMELVARFKHEEEERREAERKAREALAAQRRDRGGEGGQARLLSHKCRNNSQVVSCPDSMGN